VYWTTHQWPQWPSALRSRWKYLHTPPHRECSALLLGWKNGENIKRDKKEKKEREKKKEKK
jgi:hypothetical protein